ncbi:MAG TPA: hypothetical protein VJL31_16160, partial [Gemmatimonadales bacterium]|nr:hypothetical protein [Gemmatimonadales bacterium]
MVKWVQRRVKFAGTEVRSSQKTPAETVRVKLQRRGRSFVGRHTNGSSAVVDEINHAAEATLDALRQVVGGDTTVAIKT